MRFAPPNKYCSNKANVFVEALKMRGLSKQTIEVPFQDDQPPIELSFSRLRLDVHRDT